MNDIQYHEIYPENLLSSYAEFSNVDMLLTFQGRKLELNSLRLSGDLVVSTSTGGLVDITDNKNVFFNGQVGAHGVIESLTTSINGRVIENFQEVGRYVSMKTSATKDSDDLLQASNICELMCVNPRLTNSVIRGNPSGALIGNTYSTDTVIEPCNFSLKPVCCLNSATTGEGTRPLLSYRKSGPIKLTIRLARSAAFLYGAQALSNGASYELKNLKLTYITRADDGTDGPIFLNTKINIKQSVESDFSNIQAIVPSVANSVSCSFQPQLSENSLEFDNYQLHRIPGFNQVQYLFNDSTNQYLSFIIKSQVENLERYIASLKSGGSNNASINKLNASRGWGCGLSFDEWVPLQNQKFSVQLNSSIGSGGAAYIMYLYFTGIIQL